MEKEYSYSVTFELEVVKATSIAELNDKIGELVVTDKEVCTINAVVVMKRLCGGINKE